MYSLYVYNTRNIHVHLYVYVLPFMCKHMYKLPYIYKLGLFSSILLKPMNFRRNHCYSLKTLEVFSHLIFFF